MTQTTEPRFEVHIPAEVWNRIPYSIQRIVESHAELVLHEAERAILHGAEELVQIARWIGEGVVVIDRELQTH